MVARREFSRKVKAQAFERCEGRCEDCGARLAPGKFTYDHDNPDALGGEPTLENCKVLCDACDNPKTYQQDIPRIAKMKRVRDKHIGAATKTRRPLRDPRWKKKIDGTVVRR